MTSNNGNSPVSSLPHTNLETSNEGSKHRRSFDRADRKTDSDLLKKIPLMPVVADETTLQEACDDKIARDPGRGHKIKVAMDQYKTVLSQFIGQWERTTQVILERLQNAEQARQKDLVQRRKDLVDAQERLKKNQVSLRTAKSGFNAGLSGYHIQNDNYTKEGLYGAVVAHENEHYPLPDKPQSVPPLDLPKWPELPQIAGSPADISVVAAQISEKLSKGQSVPLPKDRPKVPELFVSFRSSQNLVLVLLCMLFGPIFGAALCITAGWAHSSDFTSFVLRPGTIIALIIGPIGLATIGAGWKWSIEQMMVLKHPHAHSSTSRFFLGAITVFLALITLGDISAEKHLFASNLLNQSLSLSDKVSLPLATDLMMWLIATIASGMVIAYEMVCGYKQGKKLSELFDDYERQIAAIEEVEESERKEYENAKHYRENLPNEIRVALQEGRKTLYTEYLKWTAEIKQITDEYLLLLEPHQKMVDAREKEIKDWLKKVQDRNEKIDSTFTYSGPIQKAITELSVIQNLTDCINDDTELIRELEDEIRDLTPLPDLTTQETGELEALAKQIKATRQEVYSNIFGDHIPSEFVTND